MKRKILKIILILLFLVITFSNSINFATVESIFTGEMSNEGATKMATATKTILGIILDAVRIIGIGIAIIILTYVGIKFMLAAPSERANIKQYSINYVIGAFILIGATGILTIVRDFALTIKTA